MYATKTKKITSYGRRGHRIVAARDDRGALKIQDLELELTIPTKATRLSSIYSSAHSKASSENFSSAVSSPARNVSKKAKAGNKLTQRAILGDYPTNVSNSPALASKRTAKTRLVGKGTPRRQFSPFTDVEIIVHDEQGRRLSQEKRVLKASIQTNMVGNPLDKSSGKKAYNPPKAKTAQQSAVLLQRTSSNHSLSSDSSYEAFVAKQKPKLGVTHPPLSSVKKTRQRRVIVSDSDEETYGPCSQHKVEQPVNRKAKQRNIVVSSDSEGPSKKTARSKSKSPQSDIASSRHTNSSGKGVPEIEVIVPRASASLESYISLEELNMRQRQAFESVSTSSISKLRAPNSPTNLPQSYSQPITLTPHPIFKRSKPHVATPIRFKPTGSFFRHARDIGSTVPSDTESDLEGTLEEIEKMLLSVSIQAGLSELPPAILKTKSTQNNTTKSSLQRQRLAPSRTVIPTYLDPLLKECGQDDAHDFDAFVETFPAQYSHMIFDQSPCSSMTPRAQPEPKFQKIGEASYSEVFGIGDVVLKVIPLRDESVISNCASASEVIDEPSLSDAQDVVKEIIVTKFIGEICAGFIRLLSAHLVKGRYPARLLSLWDDYHEEKGSEGVRPGNFSSSQYYIIIVLPNGGPDLEAFSFAASSPKSSWRQACSIFWQVTKSLSIAEELVHFEHRDLHWGQILVKQFPTASTSRQEKKNSALQDGETMYMDDPAHGVQATIIDLGLARIDRNLNGEGQTYWTHFDPVIFEGEGEYQFDIYRMMREYNGDSWEEYRPFTNVMWLHYLSVKLLHAKRLRVPTTRSSRKTIAAGVLRVEEIEIQSYRCLVEIEKRLNKVLSRVRQKKARSETKRPDKMHEINCAGDVLAFGRASGWVQ